MRSAFNEVLAASVLFAITATDILALTLAWDADGTAPIDGGSGTWNTSAARWTVDGTAYQTWNNAAGDTAAFGATAGTVSLGENVSAAALVFGVSGYTLDGAPNTLTLLAPRMIDTGASDATVDVVVKGGMTKQGSGMLLLKRRIDYAGTTTLDGGTLKAAAADVLLGNSTTFGNGLVELKNGAVFDANGYAQTVRSLSGTAGAIVTNSGALETLSWGATGNNTFAGTISGALNIHIVDRTQTLSGVNTFTGYTSINKTQLTVSATDFCLPRTTDLRFSNNSSYGTLAIGATRQQLAGLDYTGGFADRKTVSGSVGGRLVLDSGSDFTYNGIVSGGLTLVKDGNGRQTLGGACTYTGGTVVSNGTLRVIGSLARAGIEIESGAVLDGSGTLNAVLGAADGDRITVRGSLNAAGIRLAISFTASPTVSSYTLVDYASGTFAGPFAGVTGVPEGWRLTDTGDRLVLAEVPSATVLLIR